MSARDAESGSSTYKGGGGSVGSLGNGGVGGGASRGGAGGGWGNGGNWGAGWGGGRANRNNPQLGLTTGTKMYGNVAYGTPGGVAWGYATQAPMSGGYSNFVNYNGGQFASNPFGNQNANTAFGQLARAYDARKRGG